jgi:NADP-dependent 3-hydroxy acid dehydrogenase YdfG
MNLEAQRSGPDFGASLDGFRVIVTGAGNGIGRALAIQLLDAGAFVIAFDRDGVALDQLAATSSGEDRLVTHAFDLADHAALVAAYEQAIDQAGALEGIVHCAGYGPYRPFLDYDRDHWEKMFQINLTAYADLVRCALPAMIARGRGHLIAIGSERGDNQAPKTSIYAATKAGLAAFSRALALDYGAQGIHVCVVAPGGVKTNFGDRLADSKDPRFLTPEMVADTIVFMLRHRNHAWVRDMTILPLGV